VSVLDGGYPALVEQLLVCRGSVEPVIVDFDKELWTTFKINTGRSNESDSVSFKIKSASATVEKISQRRSLSARFKDVNEEERLKLALQVAERLNHKHTAQVLRKMMDDKGIVTTPERRLSMDKVTHVW
jgi:predicted aminopeptidase